MKKIGLTAWITGSLILGILTGYLVHTMSSPYTGQRYAANVALLTKIFLFLIQMLIAPLVFSTLVVGISRLGNLKSVGRVSIKTFCWFIGASMFSLTIGLVVVNFFHPGTMMHPAGHLPIAGADSSMQEQFSLETFVNHVFTKSVVESMANNAVLQLVVFSIFFGAAAASLGEKAGPLIKALDIVAHIVLKMVDYVMMFAPFAVFGATSSVIATSGLEVFDFYSRYLFYFLLAILLLWAVLLCAGWLILRNVLPKLLKILVQPMLVAFSTTSSEAVFPKLTEELENFGCKEEIVAFTLPLAYSFNLDGSMMYMTFATISIAQIYHMHMSLGTQVSMLMVLMLMSKGIAGVPRAALVVITATAAMFKIPPEGIALLLPVDHLCDMMRSMTNVLGNALSTTVVCKWEKALYTASAPHPPT